MSQNSGRPTQYILENLAVVLLHLEISHRKSSVRTALLPGSQIQSKQEGAVTG